MPDGSDPYIGQAVVVPLSPSDLTLIGWIKRLYNNLIGGTAGTPGGAVLTVQFPEDGVALTKVTVIMTGVSAVLVAASTTRRIVIVSSTTANASAAIDPTGGAAALTAGMPLEGGDTLTFTGKSAQSAMTQIGTNTQLLTVYTG